MVNLKNFEEEIEEMCGNCEKIIDCNGKKKTIKACLKRFMCNKLIEMKKQFKKGEKKDVLEK